MNVTLYPIDRVESHIHLDYRGLPRAEQPLQAVVGAQDAEGVDGEEAAPVAFGGR